MIVEIHTASEALTEARRLLGTSTPGATDLWRSFSTSPLAAVLLTTAHRNAGVADLAAVRDVLLGPATGPDGDPGSSWTSAASLCPHAALSAALRRAAALSAAQRDSVRLTILDALGRS